ncbi:sulfate/thiosulfate transport system permease protein [Marchantia polymorpha subsp. ruderalis]|uniref:Probable sulfate transport system permease protein cysT n=2 Tax=Marchantia polymorpha TaxID=3197 RepID=A0AAF6BP09_MARPO|nr:hypothetical protein MARPO_0097s0047 [Marchantia polymorpha]BBN13743.1 hypothetical protein Mp_6g05970 [Marchantia polymorpha subsp. ruderalis]|eukprot:PTQ32569.1 hypothetical protein MARPO_0097s0047 [Marchantia polymorpha]
MADQLRASVALSSAPALTLQHSPKGFSPLCVPIPRRNSLSAAPSRLNLVSGRLPNGGGCGSAAVQGRCCLDFQSSFLRDGAFQSHLHGSLSSSSFGGSTSKRRTGVARAAGPAGTGIRKTATGGTVPTKPGQFLLIGIAVAYMSLIVIIPFLNVFVQAFSFGIRPFINNLLDPAFQSAVRMTLTVAGIVLPINTIFGLIIAIWVTRHDFPGKALLLSAIDLPFSISPVVVGLMLMLLYGRQGVFAPWLRATNLEIVFALPGMIIATCFVTLPFVVREVIPVLQEMDPYEEEAARTMGANDWEVFWQVTLPNIRLGLLYGITLCNARAMGEFGAVSVISGNIIGRTQTLTLFVEAAYKEYNTQGAFSAALLLSVFAVITLFIKTKLEDERTKQLSVR